MFRSTLKHTMVASSLALAMMALAGQANAVCTGNTRITSSAALVTLLGGKTVCVPAVTVPTMTWQEKHVGVTAAGGQLIDFKRGPGHAIDPEEPVGTWSVISNNGGQQAQVVHNYGTGGTYTYTVHNNGDGTHSFCAGALEFIAAIKAGPGC